MTHRNINQLSTVVSFYDGNNICNSNNKNFVSGAYSHDNIKSFFTNWVPNIVKINAKTTLTVYFGPKTQNGTALNHLAKDDMMVYNNPYDDRFVVVQLPDKIIIGFNIKQYSPLITKFTVSSSRIYFSTVDILIIIILLIILWYCGFF
jgi:hypothetical protein